VRPLLIAAVGRVISSAPLGRRADDIEVRRVPVLPDASSLDAERPTVIVLDRALLRSAWGNPERLVELARGVALVGLGDSGEAEPPSDFPIDLLTGYLPADAHIGTIMAMLRGAFRHAVALVGERHALAEQSRRHEELAELTRLGVALSTEHNLLTLLEMILSQARRITASDARSL